MLAGVMIGTEAESGRRVSELLHTESCQDRLDAHLHLYSTLAWTSIAITLIMGFGSRMIVKRIMDGRILAAARAWRVLAYASFLAGAAKFLLGLILLSMIGCPEACKCAEMPTQLYLYPILCLFLGMVWLYRGRSYHRLINNTAATAALQQFDAQFSAAQLNRAPSSEEVSHVNGDVVVAMGVPLEQTSLAAGPSKI